MKKKVLALLLLLSLCLVCVTGCGKDEKKDEKKEETKATEKLDMSVEDIIKKVYDGIKEDDLPNLVTMEVDQDSLEYYVGVNEKIEEAIVSEPMMGSVAHSVVVVKFKDDVDIEKTKSAIQKKAKDELYNKWICVDAENVFVESKGNVIILIMTDELDTKVAETIRDNFKNLK